MKQLSSWQDFESYHAEHPRARWPKVKLYYATELQRSVDVHDGTIKYTLLHYGTPLLTYFANGEIYIHKVDGWHTATTKRRYNNHLPWPYYVYSQRKFLWYLINVDTGTITRFAAGYLSVP